MTKKIQLAIGVILIIIITTIALLFSAHDNSELQTIKSERELEKIYQGNDYSDVKEWVINILGMPFSILSSGYNYYSPRYYNSTDILDYDGAPSSSKSSSSSTGTKFYPSDITAQATTDSSRKSSITDSLTSKKNKRLFNNKHTSGKC